MYRCGIIGCGRIGTKFDECHASAYRQCPDTELIVCCDASIDQAINACKKWSVPVATSDIGDFNAEVVEIVSVCTPPETHLDVIKDIMNLQTVQAIYLEKPIATTLEDADEIIRLCHEKDVILQVNHQRRFGRPTFFFSRGVLNTMSHGYDMLRQLHIPIEMVDIVEIKTDKPIFELRIPTEGLITKGVQHLIECIENHKESISSGEEAREALRLCLKLKERDEFRNR